MIEGGRCQPKAIRMLSMNFKNALVSVSDKTGLVEFIKPLAEQGTRIVSTGGTAKLLRDAGVKVVDVSEQTGFPEVMDGRVKTLHPNVHMALLARKDHKEDAGVLDANNLEPFDLVVGNLYPFAEALKKNLTLKEQVEFIDIGGPSFLRAAAKSFDRIAVVCDPGDYSWILDTAELTQEQRQKLAGKIYAHTSAYDSLISDYLLEGDAGQEWTMGGQKVSSLRYGENPQQKADWYGFSGAQGGLHEAEKLQGKELSYNNLLDLDAAISTLRDFASQPACVSVKHNNPCGIAIGASIEEAVKKSLKADPISVFGGIVAVNKAVTEEVARSLTELFLECVVAPDFSAEALELLAKKKNLRLLRWPDMLQSHGSRSVKMVDGGFLTQDLDVCGGWQDEWNVIGEAITDQDRKAFEFAWKSCAHLKSNAIAICSHEQSVGMGMGQVNRVDAVEQAVQRWQNFHKDITNVVLASDAFFPFPDSIELAHSSGIRKVIQPGGSIKDAEVIARALELGVQMVLTGKRHFLH